MISEQAIWCVFDALIKAGLVMEQGDVFGPRAGWVGGPVVHLDMKPENLFIGDFPDQQVGNNWAIYPTFKVADFGHSFDDRRDLRDHSHYRDRGTHGYQAPEQVREHYYHGRPPIDPLNTKTNVWGVGITVMALTNLNSNAGELLFHQAAGNEDHPGLIPSFTADAVNKYSLTLRSMVLSCLQYRHANRPTFTTLLTQLQNATGLGGPQSYDLAQGARFANMANQALATPLFHLKPNTYVAGFQVPPGDVAI